MSELESLGSTAGLAGAGIYAVKKAVDGLDRLFGPMTDEVADAMKRWAANQLKNVGRVTENAERKTDRETIESGSIPLRAAMKILEESASAEESVVVDYLGGVLASSKTPTGRDDRGVALSATIARLSCYDLRAHYVFYATVRTLLLGSGINLFDVPEVNESGQLFLPFESTLEAMDLPIVESSMVILYEAIYTLRREGLLEIRQFGEVEHLSTRYPGVPTHGLVLIPTPAGASLFLWAHGRGSRIPNEVVAPDLELPEFEEAIFPVEGAQLTSTFHVDLASADAPTGPADPASDGPIS